MMYRISFILILAILLSCQKDDSHKEQKIIKTPQELTNVVSDLMSTYDVPGIALSIVKNEKVIFQDAFGLASIEANTPYTIRTTQSLASVSKTFIAAALVKAVEDGLFTLETNINDILPIEIDNPHTSGEEIKVKHLVTHTSGLKDERALFLSKYKILPGEDMSTNGADAMKKFLGSSQGENAPLKAYLESYFLDDGELYSAGNFSGSLPGTNWDYCNTASALCAYLIEAATGKSFKNYVKEYVLDPLNMISTAYGYDDLDENTFATLYWDINTPLPKYEHDSYPDGGIHSSNADMTRYLTDMMKGLNGNSSTLFSKASYEILFKKLLDDNFTSLNHGVFWQITGGFIEHGGTAPGTTCTLELSEDGEWGYVLQTNINALIDPHEKKFAGFISGLESAMEEFIKHN